jgi:hypothetical protein
MVVFAGDDVVPQVVRTSVVVRLTPRQGGACDGLGGAFLPTITFEKLVHSNSALCMTAHGTVSTNDMVVLRVATTAKLSRSRGERPGAKAAPNGTSLVHWMVESTSAGLDIDGYARTSVQFVPFAHERREHGLTL